MTWLCDIAPSFADFGHWRYVVRVDDFFDRVDPELLPGLRAMPADMLDLNDIPGTRARVETTFAQLPPPNLHGVTTHDVRVPGPPDAPEVFVRITQPNPRPALLPALLWLHGGGFCLGDVAGEDGRVAEIVRQVQCVAVSVAYRLAPEHPFPAAIEDSYAALVWLAANSTELGIDPARIAIAGGSAGGGLTAGLALLTRDRGEITPCFQMPLYPMLDDRCYTPSSQRVFEPRVWNTPSNALAWRAYLGHEPGDVGVSPYAAPIRAPDLRGLPPAYIAVGELDLFLDEDISYAHRLLNSGVPTELHTYPGTFHAADIFAPDATPSRRFIADYMRALRAALHR